MRDSAPSRYRLALVAARVPLVMAVLALSSLGAEAGAQALPSEPIALFGDQIVLSGELSLTGAPHDDGYYNNADYDQNLLRLVSGALAGSWRISRQLWTVGELRVLNADVRATALYVRYQPWPERSIALQAGRIPPVFGAFARRAYGHDNPLVGLPLAYQYLTALRPDAVPATADSLLAVRGLGWRLRYPSSIGSQTVDHGVPMVSALRWDSGVQISMGSRPVQVSAAWTAGTLANPRVTDDNDGRQWAARVAYRPAPPLTVGVSASRGEFLASRVTDELPRTDAGDSYAQTAFGLDVEASHAYWIVRAELIASRWQLPALEPAGGDDPLRAVAVSIEGRYRLTPRVHLALRGDRLTFSRITGRAFDGRPTSWDAPVTRLEVGGGYLLARNVVAKVAYQQNWRRMARWPAEGLAAVQLLYWF